LKCPRCITGTLKRRHSSTRGATPGYQKRQRICANCSEQYTTYEIVTPTAKGALAVKLNVALREIVAFTLDQHRLAQLGGNQDQSVQIRRRVTSAFGLRMMIEKRMKNGKLNSLFRQP